MEFKEFLKSAASVKPSARQMEWFDTEFYAFVHFTVNTYTDLEWGHGSEDPAIFNPYDLNCDEWVEAVKSGFWLRTVDGANGRYVKRVVRARKVD